MNEIYPWSESLKNVQVWGEHCGLAHCRCENARKTLIAICDTEVVQNYSRQDLFQDSRTSKTLAFRAVCVEYTSWSLARFKVRDRRETILASNSSSEFPRSEATLMRFFLAGKKTAYFGSARNTQLIEVFFAITELLALAVVDSLVLIGQKRDPDKNRVVLWSLSGLGLFCPQPIRALLGQTASSSAYWILVSYGLRR